jgi:hypothetical protein
MARMNYGKRFRTSAVSVGVKYDPSMDLRIPSYFKKEAGSIEAVFAAAKMAGASKAAGRRAALSKPAPVENLPEEIFRDRLEAAVKAISFAASELLESGRCSKINYSRIATSLDGLCCAVRPALQRPMFGASRRPGQTKMCLECGEPTFDELCAECRSRISA